MTLSVRLDPAIEARLEEEARRLGISKSEFVKDALVRTLGMKDPAALLRQVRSESVATGSGSAEDVSGQVRKKISEKHSR